MIGVTISRWTMSYFAAALASLVAALVLMASGYGFPSDPIRAPETLVVVHLVAIGWLSLLMCGALFQFVPVLVAYPIHSNALPLPALVCLAGGLAALILGFRQLAAPVGPEIPYLALAAVSLVAGFALVLWNLGRTLWAARPLPLPARFVVVGLAGIAATAGFGAIFALVLGGATANPHLVEAAAAGLPIHAVAGIGGWLTFTAMGVSYRLLAMFMLAPEHDRAGTGAVFYLGAASLAVVVLGGVAAICAGRTLTIVLSVAAVLGLAALGLYGRDMIHLYRVRRRRAIELNSRMAGVALANLAAAVALTLALLGAGAFDRHVGAVVFLAAFGWLSGLGLAKLYKIVAFLTWLESYGPVLGKAATPRVQDLVVERRAARWFLLYFVAVAGGTVALLADAPLAFRGLAGVMATATSGIVVELLRIRRLADVAVALRLPDGVHRPLLLVSRARQA
ncbi:MAG: hypothetical protein L6R19_18770 [Alphaproteobacteria bacterium]|nr:hypothetical protein [Alphaproteobacteria bacterium]